MCSMHQSELSNYAKSVFQKTDSVQVSLVSLPRRVYRKSSGGTDEDFVRCVFGFVIFVSLFIRVRPTDMQQCVPTDRVINGVREHV